jgi:hypothetical protein
VCLCLADLCIKVHLRPYVPTIAGRLHECL